MGIKRQSSKGRKPKARGRSSAANTLPSPPPTLSALEAEKPGSIEFLRDAVLITDASSLDIIACNAAACSLYGYTRAEFLSMNMLALSPIKERELARNKLLRPATGKKEFQHIKNDGMPIVVEFDNVRLQYGDRAAFLCLIHDVSTRSHLVRALLESDAMHREIIENASDIIYTHDLNGNFTSVNRAATQLLGYTREEALHLNVRQVVAQQDLNKALKMVSAKTADHPVAGPYNLTVVEKNGNHRTLEVSTRLIFREGQVTGIQGIARDVTERLRVENALRESEAKFRAMAESATCAILIYQGTRLVYVNPAAAIITGYTTEELLQIREFWNLAAPEYRQLIRERSEARQRGELKDHRYEFKILHRSGTEKWMDFTATTIRYESAPAVLVMVFDITERKAQERALQESEERFRRLFERNLSGVFVSTLEGKLLNCNESFAHIFGYSCPAEIMRVPTVELYSHADDRSAFIARLRAAGSLTGLESVLRRRSGELIWVLENVSLIEGRDGSPDLLQGTLVDITERKNAEHALIESEQKFRAVAETAHSAIYIHNGERFLYVNQASQEISGYSAEELLGLSPFEIVHPDDRKFVAERGRARQRGEETVQRYEYRIVRKDGSPRWLDFSASVIQFEGESALLCTAFDITERKRVENLQAALYRIAGSANAGQELPDFYSSIHNVVGELMYARNFYIALYDRATETLTFPYFADERDPGPAGAVPLGKGRTEYVLRQARAALMRPEEFSALHAEGVIEQVGPACLDWIGAPLMNVNECFGVIAVQSYTRDIRYTESDLEILNFVSQHLAAAILRKRHEEALRMSEERYRSLIQSAVYGIYRSGAEDRFLEVNPALVRMLGYDSIAEVLALRLSRDVYADAAERPKLISQYQHAAQLEDIEVRWRRRDHKIITVRLSGRTVYDLKGDFEAFEMIAEDITDRRALEDQLRQAQKMEAVGRLAGGIAHDFNNLLTVIKGYSELALEELKTTDPLRGEMEEIQRAADRAASLTRQLLAFSRQQVLTPKVLDMNGIVSNMERLLNRLLGADIQLHASLDPALGRVKADPGQLEQVIMNLAVNARDAMPDGGKLTIETANIQLDDTYVRDHMGAKPGSYVMLAVSDTGCGMPEAVRQRIFEPFFTTKELGKGTGLGLSTVYGIVKQSEGYIWCYSELKMGTTFKLYLPRVDAPIDVHDEKPPSETSYRGKETVLLVEDEDGVRALVRQVLNKHGYSVLEARHGGEALLHAERHPGDIDLLVTDVVLEHIQGPELARRLNAVRPTMKVLYISGYTDDAVIQHGVLDQKTAFLQKPFTTEGLVRKIREVLEGAVKA